MKATIAALGLGCALLAGCASGTETADNRPVREEGYIPTGSNIPRKEPKRADLPSITGGGLDSMGRGAGATRTQ